MTGSFDPYYEWLGIPHRDQPPNLYRLLGIEAFESNPTVIENAADRQMAHLRTYQSGKHSDKSQRLLNEISKAKVVLLTPEKKSAYDAKLRNTLGQKASQTLVAPQELPSNAIAPAPPRTVSDRRSRGNPSLLTHPAVLAGGIGGVLLAVIGLVVYLAGGGGNGNGTDPNLNVVQNPSVPGPKKPDRKPGTVVKPATDLPATFGLDDPIPSHLFARPDASILDELNKNWGMTGEQFAICQTGSLDKLEKLSLRMARTGYRLDRLRPYRFNSELKYAAIWRRDGRPWRAAFGRTPGEIKAIDQTLRKRGFMPVDVAGYDDGIKYAGVWWIPGVGGAETSLTIGLTRGESQGLVAAKKTAGWVPQTLHFCFNQDGVRYESEIWRKAKPGDDIFIRSGDRQQFDNLAKKTMPIASSYSVNPKSGKAYFGAVWDKTNKAPKAWEMVGAASPRLALPDMRKRMKENMEPYTLDVIRVGRKTNARLVSTSIWNLKPGVPASPRLAALMASRGAAGSPAVVANDTLLFQGQGGVEILNTEKAAQLGADFTAEMWVRLAQHPSDETRDCLMGTVRGTGPPTKGWQLIARESPGSGKSKLEFHYGGSSRPITRSIDGDFSKWRHVALGFSTVGRVLNVTFYADGKPVASDPLSKSQLIPANNNLTLGIHPSGAGGETFYGAIRQFRLSLGDRFANKPFAPAAILSNDVATAALLNFKNSNSMQLQDVSGKNHFGVRRSAIWLASGASFPPHPGGTRVAANNAPSPSPNDPKNSTGPPAAPMAHKRAPAPKASAIDAAVAQIREIYSDDYRRATTPTARVALAETLRKQSQEESDVASRYALLQEAANAAAAGSDVTMALGLVSDLESQYEGSLWKNRSDLISTAFKSSRSKPQKLAVAQSAYDLAEQAVREDEFDIAVKLYDSASAEARRAGDTDLAKMVNLRNRKVKAIRDDFRKASDAEIKVAAGTATPADYLTLGTFKCFLRGEWEDGLPLLEKSSDPELAKLAGQEKTNPSDADGQTKLAGQWKTFGEALKNEQQKTASLGRAYHWYSKALPQLSGLKRAGMQRTLNELATQLGGAALARPTEKLAFLDVKPGEIHRFQGHTRDIVAMAVSPSGRYLASASYDGSLRIWDIATGKELHQLTSASRRTTFGGVAFSADERLVLAGTHDNSVAAFDVRSGQPAGAIPANSNVYDIDVSRDGRKLIFATSNSQANVGIVNLTKRKPLGFLKAQSYPRMVRLSADGNKAVTADSSGNVTLWNLISYKPEANYNPQGGSINDLAYSPDGRFVAIALSSDAVEIWNPSTRSLESTLKEDNGISSVRSVQVTPDGKHVVVADYYKGLVVWNVATKKVVGSVGANDRFRSSSRWRIVRLLPDPRGAVVGDSSGNLALFRLPKF